LFTETVKFSYIVRGFLAKTLTAYLPNINAVKFDCFHPVVYTVNLITLYRLDTTIIVSSKSYNLLIVSYMFRLLTSIIRLIQKDDAN